MGQRRLSLAEIAKEEGFTGTAESPERVDVHEQESTPNLAPQPSKPAVQQHSSHQESPRSTTEPAAVEHSSAEKRIPKSDFIKMTVTVPPEMFEQLEDVSRARRRAKQPFTISDLVREAVTGWLPPQKHRG